MERKRRILEGKGQHVDDMLRRDWDSHNFKEIERLERIRMREEENKADIKRRQRIINTSCQK